MAIMWPHERCFYVQSCMMMKKDIEIQPGALVLIMQSSPSLREIQLENRTVSMDRCHLSSAPMPELQWLSW